MQASLSTHTLRPLAGPRPRALPRPTPPPPKVERKTLPAVPITVASVKRLTPTAFPCCHLTTPTKLARADDLSGTTNSPRHNASRGKQARTLPVTPVNRPVICRYFATPKGMSPLVSLQPKPKAFSLRTPTSNGVRPTRRVFALSVPPTCRRSAPRRPAPDMSGTTGSRATVLTAPARQTRSPEAEKIICSRMQGGQCLPLSTRDWSPSSQQCFVGTRAQTGARRRQVWCRLSDRRDRRP